MKKVRRVERPGIEFVDFYMTRAEDLRTSVTIIEDDDDETPIEITGASVVMECRIQQGAAGDPVLACDTTAATANGSVITLTDADAGELEIFLDDEDVADAFDAVSDSSAPIVLAYDVRLTPPLSDSTVILAGNIYISHGVVTP